jgi:hypothetical protein
MAEKKAILLIGGKVDLQGGGNALKKFSKKSVALTKYTPGDVAGQAFKVPGCSAVSADGLKAVFEGGSAFAVVSCGNAGPDEMESILAQVLEVADRRTLVVLAAENALLFYGLGVTTKASSVDREAFARDVVPTIAHIVDLPLPDDTTGAVLYQALKETNLKLNEFLKLKEALGRMEAALQRGSQEPWDKHDCA